MAGRQPRRGDPYLKILVLDPPTGKRQPNHLSVINDPLLCKKLLLLLNDPWGKTPVNNFFNLPIGIISMRIFFILTA